MFKVSAFRLDTRPQTGAPLSDCRINNTLVKFTVTSRWERRYTVKAVHIVDNSGSTSRSIISCLGPEIFVQVNRIVTKFCPTKVRGSDNYDTPCTFNQIPLLTDYLINLLNHFSVYHIRLFICSHFSHFSYYKCDAWNSYVSCHWWRWVIFAKLITVQKQQNSLTINTICGPSPQDSQE